MNSWHVLSLGLARFLLMSGFLLAVGLRVSSFSMAEVSKNALGRPIHFSVLPLEFSQSGVVEASNAFIVTFRNEPKPEVFLVGRDGGFVSRSGFSLQDAAKAFVYAVAVNQEGLVVASVNFWKSDGTIARTLVLIEKPGKIIRIIRTNPVTVEALCLGSEQSIWALVFDRDAEEERRDYRVIQKYNMEGRLLGDFLPRSEFPIHLSPAFSVGGKAGFSSVRCSGKSVGVYSSATREWIELGNEGKIVGRWPVNPSINQASLDDRNKVAVETIVLTDSGSVYLEGRGTYQRQLYTLNRDLGSWIPMEGTLRDIRDNPMVGRLSGLDGDKLVFYDRTTPGRLLWFQAPK